MLQSTFSLLTETPVDCSLLSTGDDIGDAVVDDTDEDVDTGDDAAAAAVDLLRCDDVNSESIEKFNFTLDDATGTVAFVSLASIATITCQCVSVCVSVYTTLLTQQVK